VHSGIAEAEIKRIVGNPDPREREQIAPTDTPFPLKNSGTCKRYRTGDQEPDREQKKRWTIRKCNLRHRKGRAPQQAERRDE
jgi:hypothetical protein